MDNRVVFVDTHDEFIRNFQEAGWDGPGWYYWNKDITYIHGPFKDYDEALENKEEYDRIANRAKITVQGDCPVGG